MFVWPYLCPCEITASTCDCSMERLSWLIMCTLCFAEDGEGLEFPLQTQGFVLPFSVGCTQSSAKGRDMHVGGTDGLPWAAFTEDLAVFRSCASAWFIPVRSDMREACGCVLPLLWETTLLSPWKPLLLEGGVSQTTGNLSDCPAHLQQKCFERTF